MQKPLRISVFSVLAAAFLAGCPVEPPAFETLSFACDAETPCSDGFTCTDGVCVAETADGGFDAGIPDAGHDAGPDAGLTDAGFDAGLADAGLFDAGLPDAGLADAGQDAGPDAGPLDGGPVDAGVLRGLPTVVNTPEDTPVRLSPTVADTGGQAVQLIELRNAPRTGTLSPTADPGVLDFVPHANAFTPADMPDVITFVPWVNGQAGAPSTLTIHVAPVNDAPTVAGPTSLAGHEDQALPALQLSVGDVDGDALTTRVDVPSMLDAARTTTSLAAGVLTLEARVVPHAAGTDVLTVYVSDGTIETGHAVTVTVLPVNDAPVLYAATTSADVYMSAPGAPQHATWTLTLSDVDHPADTLSVETMVNPAGQGTCTYMDGTLTLTPAPGVQTNVSCIASVVDPAGARSAPATFTAQVHGARRSCLELLNDPVLAAAGLARADGVYMIDPDIWDDTAPYPAYCDMTRDGGGWTLALRARGDEAAAGYTSALWTEPDTLRTDTPSPDVGPTEKWRPFNDLPATEIRVDLAAGDPPAGPIPAFGTAHVLTSAASLLSTFEEGRDLFAPTDAADAAAWLDALPGSALQAHCRTAGVNQRPDPDDDTVYGGVPVRIGIRANNEDACSSFDSWLGVGGDVDTRCAFGAVPTSGNVSCIDAPDRQLSAFARVWVRESSLVHLDVATSCAAHRLNGHTQSGLYLVDADDTPEIVWCDQTRFGGGWTRVLTQAGQTRLGADRADAMLTAQHAFGIAGGLSDYRADAYDVLDVNDVLFAARGNTTHALYRGAVNNRTLRQAWGAWRNAACDRDKKNTMHMSEGNLAAAQMCSSALVLSPRDRDGDPDSCSDDNNAIGPAWSIANNDGCPLDDPDQAQFFTTADVPGFGPGAVDVYVRDTDFRSLSREASCAAHLDLGRTISGTYRVESPSGNKNVYCAMENGVAWMRVVGFDLGHTDECGGFHRANNPRRCQRNTDGTRSRTFNAHGYAYSHVRGFVRAIQRGSPDAFKRVGSAEGIDGPYVDGVSITHGAPRQHIFTYAAGWAQGSSAWGCPCDTGGAEVPSFVGANYRCDSAVAAGGSPENTYYTDNQLFDRFSANACSAQPGDPWWFERTLDVATTDAVEVRIMADENRSNEDVVLKAMELYVR